MNTDGFKGKNELKAIAEKVIDLLRREELPIWQAREVLRFADKMPDWEVMGYK